MPLLPSSRPAFLTFIVSLATCVAVGGCAHDAPRRRSVPLNLSTPKDAALTFVRAIGQGDAATAKAASLGTDAQKHWIDAVAGLIDGLRRLDEALLGRFGQAAERMHINLNDSLRPLSEHAEAEIESATVKEVDQQASVIPLGRTVSIQVPYARRLRLDHGTWKVDLPTLYTEDPRLGIAAESPDIQIYERAGNALRGVARDIASGRYKTLAAARDAVNEQMGSVHSGIGVH